MSNSIRWTPEQLAAHNQRSIDKLVRQDSARQRVRALGRLKTGTMNKTEARYATHLELQKHTRSVLWYKFEGLKFRLADNTFYTPDFMVLLESGALEAHEVKGRWEDDARAKIKIAADMYPIQFIAVTVVAEKDGGGWKFEEF